jgi:hypothetical protein
MYKVYYITPHYFHLRYKSVAREGKSESVIKHAKRLTDVPDINEGIQ